MDQPCALLIGLTNRVHPYCRLAIITMQTMQQMSLIQRVPSDTFTPAALPAAIVIGVSP